MRSRYCNNAGIEDLFNMLATGSVFSLASDRKVLFRCRYKIKSFQKKNFFDMKLKCLRARLI